VALNEAEVFAGLRPIFEEVLDTDATDITRETSAADVPNWDSLAHLEITEMVQRQYRIKFSLQELQHLKTVGDMVDLIVAKTAN